MPSCAMTAAAQWGGVEGRWAAAVTAISCVTRARTLVVCARVPGLVDHVRTISYLKMQPVLS